MSILWIDMLNIHLLLVNPKPFGILNYTSNAAMNIFVNALVNMFALVCWVLRQKQDC